MLLALRSGFWDDWPVATNQGQNMLLLTPVYAIDRSNTQGSIDPLLTADTTIVESYPAAQRHPSVFYLPKRLYRPSSSEPAGITPLYRGNTGLLYTKRLNQLGFVLEETLGKSWPDAFDETTRRLLSPGRLDRGRGSGGKSVRGGVEANDLGWGWVLNNSAKHIERSFTIPGSQQTHTVSFDMRGGGGLTNWRIQMDTPSVDRQIINRRDYGRAFQSALFWNEHNTGAVFHHNPTQMGSVWSDIPTSPGLGAVEDWEAQASPLLHFSYRPNPDGSATVETFSWPLEFNPQLHDGGIHVPVGHLGMMQGQTWTFNWGGRNGVHQVRNHNHMAFDLPFAFAAPQTLTTWTLLLSLMPDAQGFDQCWLYDAANDTETEAEEGVTGPAYDGSTDYLNFQVTKAGWDGPGGTISPPAAHPIPSGIGGTIWRDTGTLWGLGDDFAVGHFYEIGDSFLGKVGQHRQYSSFNYQAAYTTGFDTGKDSSHWETHFAETRGFGGNRRGWTTVVSWVLTGTYAQVKANMRQLYLDGLYKDYPRAGLAVPG